MESVRRQGDGGEHREDDHGDGYDNHGDRYSRMPEETNHVVCPLTLSGCRVDEVEDANKAVGARSVRVVVR
jgi:hypothetical protein